VRRVRIEYSIDELTCSQEALPVEITVSVQGTITENTGPVNGAGVAYSSPWSVSKTITLQPLGIIGEQVSDILPFFTSTAYADMGISLENPQISLSWTDSSVDSRLLIHRVTAVVNDTKGVMQ
jgi:hypothetical protein